MKSGLSHTIKPGSKKDVCHLSPNLSRAQAIAGRGVGSSGLEGQGGADKEWSVV